MSNIQRSRRALVARVVEGNGHASHAQRRQAFENTIVEGPAGGLAHKVAARACEVTDADVDAARVAGLSEDQIFEIVLCAAVGEATRQYDTALAALEAASQG